MPVYYVYGVQLASVVATDNAHCQLWNPHASRVIRVLEVALWFPDFDTATNGLVIHRTSTRGATPASTVTPDADSSGDAAATPTSGAVLEMGNFGTQPTKATPPVYTGGPFLREGSGFNIPFPRGIKVPPSTGIAITHRIAATTMAARVASFVFED